MEGSKGQGYSVNLFFGGLAQDIDPELISSEKGVLIDSSQFVVKDKLAGVVQKMNGDKRLPGHIFRELDTDRCIGLYWMNGYVIEFWDELSETSIYMNGQRVARSGDIPGDKSHHLDIDGNSDVNEIYITDGKQVPVIYNIEDMWNNLATTKYFEDYDRSLYEINSSIQLNQPLFVSLDNIGSGGGLRVGSYSYAMRYVTIVGDKSRWSPDTPYIPVPIGYSEESVNIVPNHPVYGGEPSLNNTPWGIRLRIRLTNTQGFDYIELRRYANNSGTPINFKSAPEYIQITSDSFGSSVDIRSNPIDVIEFTDNGSRQWVPLDEAEVIESSPIKSARTIRSIDGRIVLGGVTYESREQPDEDIFLEVNSKKVFAIKKRLGTQGYSLIKNQVYNKSLQTGERYGIGLKVFDNQGNSQYVIPIDANFKVPDKREAIPAAELTYSYRPCFTSTKDSNTVASMDWTYEVWEQGATERGVLSDKLNVIISDEVDYNPVTPTGRGSGYQNNNSRYEGAQSTITTLVDTKAFNPDNFNPKIIPTGVCIPGVDVSKLPSWASGFSVVRTPPAGRVVCQAIATYALRRTTINGYATKYLDRLWVYSPQFDSVIGDNPGLFDDIRNNPQNYKVQLVSPIAFHSEMFSGLRTGSNSNNKIDLASYATLFNPANRNNPVDSPAQIGWGDATVSFGRWRNTGVGDANMPSSIYNDDGNYLYQINSAIVPEIVDVYSMRSRYLEVSLEEEVYSKASNESGGSGVYDSNSATVRSFHEPFYIINIIREGVDVPNNNVNLYEDIGHYQKLNSLVGIGTGESDQIVRIVDERREDFFADYYDGIDLADPYNDRYILVGGNKWLCSNFRDELDIASYLSDIESNGFFEVNGERYYGLYLVNMDIPLTEEVSGEIYSSIQFTLNIDAVADKSKLFTIRSSDIYVDVLYSSTGVMEESDLAVLDLSDGVYVVVSNPLDYVGIGAAIAGAFGYTNETTGVLVRVVSTLSGSEYDFEITGGVTPAAAPFTHHENLIIEDYDDTTIIITTSPEDTKLREVSSISFPFVLSDSSPVVPGLGDDLIIQYNPSVPLSILLGDRVIGESLFIPIDCSVPGLPGPTPETLSAAWIHFQFRLFCPMPHYRYDLSSNYRSPVNPSGITKTQTISDVKLHYIRQWAITAIVESTVNLPLVYKDFFPNRHYVMRPLQWSSPGDKIPTKYLQDEGIREEYNIDYPDEFLDWDRGGFHFPEGSNFDYQKRLSSVGYTRPATGIIEQLTYPTRLQWSLQRNPSFRFIGANRTFPPFNIYDLKNNRASQISLLYTAYSGDKGDNLYAITDRGISLVLVNKNILRGADGAQTSLVFEGTFISGELILNAYVGCPGETWRGKAEGKVRLPNNTVVPVLIFPGYDDMILMQDNTIVEFGTNYRTTLQPLITELDAAGDYTSVIASGINERENMLMVRLGDETHMFGFNINNWMANTPLNYTKMIFSPYIDGKNENNKYVAASEGFYRTTVVETATGNFQSTTENEPCEVVFAVNPGIGNSYEFMDMFLSASHRPDYVHISPYSDFSDYADAIIPSVQEYTNDGLFYIRFPRTLAGRVLIGKNVFVRVGYNNSDQLYTLKFAKVGVKKVVGG